MSAALSLVGIDRQPTEELSFAEIEEQHAELLPARTVLVGLAVHVHGVLIDGLIDAIISVVSNDDN